MIIYSQSQSHYESAKSKLKAGDLCFIGDEKKIIFHKNAKGEGAVSYDGSITQQSLNDLFEQCENYFHPLCNFLGVIDDLENPNIMQVIFMNETGESQSDEMNLLFNFMPNVPGILATEEYITRQGFAKASELQSLENIIASSYMPLRPGNITLYNGLYTLDLFTNRLDTTSEYYPPSNTSLLLPYKDPSLSEYNRTIATLGDILQTVDNGISSIGVDGSYIQSITDELKVIPGHISWYYRIWANISNLIGLGDNNANGILRLGTHGTWHAALGFDGFGDIYYTMTTSGNTLELYVKAPFKKLATQEWCTSLIKLITECGSLTPTQLSKQFNNKTTYFDSSVRNLRYYQLTLSECNAFGGSADNNANGGIAFTLHPGGSYTSMIFMDNKDNLYYTGLFNANANSCSKTQKILMSDLSGNTSIGGTLTVSGKLTCKDNIQTPGYISTDEAYINTNYISGSLRALNDENAITMGGDFKVEAYRNATGRLYVANRITSYGSLFVEGDSYLKSTNYTGPIYLHYGNLINVGGTFTHMVINYNSWSKEQTLARICDGLTNAVADFLGSGIEFYTSLTVPSLTAQSFSTNSFNASSLSVGNVSILDSCVSVGDVHIYNEDLSYSDLEGSILEVELLNLGQTLSSSCSYSYTYNLKKGDILNLNGGTINARATFEIPSSDASAYFIYKVSVSVGGSLVAEIRAGSTIYSNNRTSGSYSGSLGTDSYTATEDCQVTVSVSCTLDSNVTCTPKGTITKSPSSGANTTLLAKNAIGLLYDSLNYFIVGMDNGVMKMKFVSGGVSMFDSTYSALE